MIKTIVHGMLVGIANIIPGVSGGTLALILGIYERLIQAINSIDIEFIKSSLKVLKFSKASLSEFWEMFKKKDMEFLAILAIGAGISIVATSKLMTYLLTNQHEPTYGFFFGLILFSVVVPYKLLTRKSWKEFVSAIVAILIVIMIGNILSPEQKLANAQKKHQIKQEKALTETKTTEKKLIKIASVPVSRALFIFFAGFLAISAMILPGISGSFILLLLGVYFDVLKAIIDRDIVIIFIFAFGCMCGIILFTRFLNWILKKYHNETIAFLIGLIIGSLYELWPFKKTAIVGAKTIYLNNIFPSDLSSSFWITILTFAIGSMIVIGFNIYESRQAK